MLNNNDAETRRLSVELLGKLDDKSVIPAVIKMLNDPDKSVVEAAKKVIDKNR